MLKNKVRAYRRSKNLTQEDLAKRVGSSRKTIVAIERGNYSPSILLALQIAEALQVDIRMLFYTDR
jgi:putative transcriptional regulator